MTSDALAGIRIHHFRHQKDCFDRDYRRLPPEVKVQAEKKLQELLKHPRPARCKIGVTSVPGYSGRIYTVDVPVGYRISFHVISVHEDTNIGGNELLTAKINIAVLRRVKKYEHLDGVVPISPDTACYLTERSFV